MSGTATGDRRTAGRIPGPGARPGRGRGRRLSGTVHDRLHRPPAQDEARVVHRVRHVRNGVVLSAIAAVATIVYTLVTDSPGRSHPVLLGLAGLVAVGVPGLLLLPLTAMMRDFRGSAMFHLWSLATIVVVLAATRIDGGPASPLDALLLLALTYTAAACSPYGVVAMGSAMTAGYVLLVELPGLTVRGMFFIAVLCAATMACALASAHSDAAWARQSDSVRLSETRASADPLAGIPSRRTFVERLESAAAAAAWGHRAAVCLVELDGFESVDDTTGHAAENAVLRRVHSALSGVLGETDTVARLARCRFAVLADVSGSVSGELLAERLCRAVSGVVGASGAAVGIGLAEVEPGDDVEDLMDRADAAMHRSGTAGRDRLRALPG